MQPTPSHTGPTARLCQRIVQARAAELGADTRRAAHRAFINWLGCALGGARDPTLAAVARLAIELSGSPQASVIARPEKLDVVNAALVNGVAANALDFDDMHVPTLIHPTGPIVAAALALAEHTHACGDSLLRAIVLGIETACRLGLALFPAHYDAGWHSTSTLGTLGAAAACASVLDLAEAPTAHALAIAATQASGLRIMLSNPCKSFNVGQAASRGLHAALLARAGLESAPNVLEGRHGLFDVLGRPEHAEAVVARFGDPYLVTQISLKPYPCGVVIHPLIDAALQVAAQMAQDVAIQQVFARVHPRALDLAGTQHPQTAIAGRFSLYQAAALALMRKSAGLDAFADENVDDSALRQLRASMQIVADPSLQPSQARIAVVTAQGRRLEAAVDSPSGSPSRPLDDDRLHAKFTELALHCMDAAAAERLYRTCSNLDRVDDCATLPALWMSSVDREVDR